ncbi:hypothetical protein WN943_010227 [Citrus x changshan-huyou]
MWTYYLWCSWPTSLACIYLDVTELKRLVAYARSRANLLTKLIPEDQTDSCRWVVLHRDRLPYPHRLLFPSEVNRGRQAARVNASKAFGPFLLLEDMKGSLEEVKNKMMVDLASTSKPPLTKSKISVQIHIKLNTVIEMR